MTIALECHQSARDCGPLANNPRNARQRDFSIALAYLLKKAALAAEQKNVKRADPAARSDIDLAGAMG